MDQDLYEIERQGRADPEDPALRLRLLRALERRDQAHIQREVADAIESLRLRDEAQRRQIVATLRNQEGIHSYLRRELEAELKASSNQRRQWALETLSQLQLLEPEPLLSISEDESAPIRARSAIYLARFAARSRADESPSRCRDRLVELSSDPKRYVRETAIQGLGRLLGGRDDALVRSRLTSLLADPSEAIRNSATAALLGEV
jgi:HEAT repeat protein